MWVWTSKTIKERGKDRLLFRQFPLPDLRLPDVRKLCLFKLRFNALSYTVEVCINK